MGGTRQRHSLHALPMTKEPVAHQPDLPVDGQRSDAAQVGAAPPVAGALMNRSEILSPGKAKQSHRQGS
jgi:hypothetical protein